jgi:protease IV
VNRTRGALGSAALLIAAMAGAGPAHAEPPVKVSDPLPDPGRSIVTNDESSSIATNPGNLAFLRAPELRWTWFYTQPGSALATRGHSFDFVYPIWFLASGLRLDVIDPPPSTPLPFQGDNYQWIRWSVGGRIGNTFGIGATFGWSIAESDKLAGQFSFTTGATYRPSSYFALSAVARDINIPRSADGITRSERSYDFGAALRPVFGSRALEVGAERQYYETS